MPHRDAPAETALAYAELFPAIYLRFHRRDGKERELSGVSRAVLLHLAQAGPLTVGEMAAHLERAQSVVSEIVAQLTRNGLVARVRDERDRRRASIWLTDEGRARLLREQEVLSGEILEAACALMSSRERRLLVEGTRALVRAADSLPPKIKKRSHR